MRTGERGKNMIEIPKAQFSFLYAIVMAVPLMLCASTRLQAGAFTSNINTQSTAGEAPVVSVTMNKM